MAASYTLFSETKIAETVDSVKSNEINSDIALCEKINKTFLKIRDDLAQFFGAENKYFPVIEKAINNFDEKIAKLVSDQKLEKYGPEAHAIAVVNFKRLINDPHSELVRALKAAPASGKYSNQFHTILFINPYKQLKRHYPELFEKRKKCIIS